ncbi:glycoside hydrolase family 95 protein [Flavobacterium sp. WLB]|uniref:glycoside hydrolase family 95 protein n=1 Tax=unclassified Flavobacterium TaxID=196869 RepID=UPI0006AB7B33|nr:MULTISPECIES: glycoside hydrolase family 95 protein [unclassified Flavobacterium]KOP36899.1 alpha-L-fucosidase [Flavobacterium sp. VMW]OWU89018.1 alpha-L-fucosidase [Flavobacterium sp. NLM]PUU70806.1 glycoside hydrolase family 95 protein [Flavobacterium sp. WLB]
MNPSLIKTFLILLFASYYTNISAQSKNVLWYDKPADFFEESLVLGNGKMGATVFGGANSDKIYLNDATLWSGEPVNTKMNPEAYKNIPEIREALKNENYKLAEELNKKIQGKNSESYAPLGTLEINNAEKGKAVNYHRELDISNAISKVSYEMAGIKYTREYFVSAPDQIMAIKLTADQKGALNFDINLKSLLQSNVEVRNNILVMTGSAPIHENAGYAVLPKYLEIKDRGTKFTTLVQIKKTDGQITSSRETLTLKDATEAIIYVSVATSFNGFDKNPATEGPDDVNIALQNLNKAFAKPFDKLKENHIADYQKFYNRVTLDLGKTTAPDLQTDERLLRYADGKEDKNLEILYFNYGRYLLISSSRTLGVPANLQGIWNPYLNPPWSSNYTMNINLEENYWLAENTNLSEMHLPLLSFIKNLSVTGKVTAKTFYGVNEGWAAAHNSDIWAMTNPVGQFGKEEPMWACWPIAGAWLSTHIWEHYIFTQDEAYLRKEGYPLMKGAAEFCLGWLVTDKNGNLITSPSTSPENQYKLSDGFVGATLYGGTADLAMIRECFDKTIKASKVLNIDADFRKKLETALAKLYPYQIGKKGNLQEWYFDWEDNDPKHRHQSQLFGLFPGDHITPLKTPDLAEASRKTLEIKGDETTGWSKGWRINLWARLWDGNRAYKMFRELLRYVDPDGKKTEKPRRGGGTYPNLFDAHPPFQIDGNFGGAAAVAEMLVQSNENEIRLLPALPDAWEQGSVKGICARGGFELEIIWNNKKPEKVIVSSKKGGKTTLIFGDKKQDIILKKGESIEVKF